MAASLVYAYPVSATVGVWSMLLLLPKRPFDFSGAVLLAPLGPHVARPFSTVAL